MQKLCNDTTQNEGIVEAVMLTAALGAKQDILNHKNCYKLGCSTYICAAWMRGEGDMSLA